MPRLTVAAAIGAIALTVLTAVPAQATTVGGMHCTIVGTPGNDRLVGTSKNDVICGLGGNDTISGGGGNDVLLGGAGNDRISGGSGNDRIDGGSGNDTISGGVGNDTISGGTGSDIVTGDSGNDTVSGGDGADKLSGGAGNDSISGGSGNDTVSGGDGNDTLAGAAGNDSISGGSGADRVTGAAGNDSVVGGAGNDTISGDSGNDTLTPGDGVDKAYGGAGNDTFKIGDGDMNDTIDGGAGVNSCYFEKTGYENPACRPLLTKTYITAFRFSTQTIDTSSVAQTVHVEAYAENEVADVEAIQVWTRTPTTSGGWTQLTFTSGTRRHGWWGGDLVFPQYSAPGIYTIGAHTQDVNNKQETLGDIGPGYGSPFHGPSTITQTGAGDASGPVVAEFALDRTQVDTSTGPATVHLRARITDDLLGTKTVTGEIDRDRSFQRYSTTLQLTSGTAMDGIWEGDFTLPQYSAQASWIVYLATSDGLHSGGRLADAAMHVVQQTGAGDGQPPSVTNLTMPLDTIDTSVGSVSLPVTVHLTDDVSGVVDGAQLRVMLPSRSVTQCTLVLQSGTRTSGDWGCTLSVGAGSPGGSYYFWLDTKDAAGNFTEITLKDLGGQTGTVHLVNSAP